MIRDDFFSFPWYMICVGFFTIGAVLAIHVLPPTRPRSKTYAFLAYLVLPLAIAGMGVSMMLQGRRTDLPTAMFYLFVIGSCVFIAIGEIMHAGFAGWLTQQRGEKWIKELDYLYLLFGSIGVVASVNRLEVIVDRPQSLDLIGPAILSIAIAIRLTKTRAEINHWDKLTAKSD